MKYEEDLILYKYFNQILNDLVMDIIKFDIVNSKNND